MSDHLGQENNRKIFENINFIEEKLNTYEENNYIHSVKKIIVFIICI